MPGTPSKSRYILPIASGILILILLEFLFYIASLLLPAGRYDYLPPTRERFSAYLEHASITKDIPSGWLPKPEKISPQGFRISPSGAGLDAPCVSLYGDSLTWANSVSDVEAWGNQLTDILGCRVDNYGVSGYGTDQAYLRFTNNHADTAPVVILSAASENIVRNINQDRAMIYSGGIILKPRFVMQGDGRLKFVPRPKLSESDYEIYVENPEKFLKHEFFIPRFDMITQRVLGFPYMFSVPYYFTYKRLYLSILSLMFDVPPWYAEFYDADHRSRALQLDVEILSQFFYDAKSRGKTPVIFILPSIRDLNYFRGSGAWVYQTVIDRLREKDINSFNVGAYFFERAGKRDFCDYLCLDKWRRAGHYTVEGNRVLAEIVQEILLELGAVRSPAD